MCFSEMLKDFTPHSNSHISLIYCMLHVINNKVILKLIETLSCRLLEITLNIIIFAPKTNNSDV